MSGSELDGTMVPMSPSSGTPPASALSPLEHERYGRQVRLPELGLAGQQRLKGSRALVVGAGGLGAPAAAALVGAGVGTLDLIDFDSVARSNLHRQLWYDDADLGKPKVHRLRSRLAAQNPGVLIRAHDRQLTPENACDLVAGHDVVLDGSDNFPTRYAVADAAWRAGVPLIHASVHRFEGHLTAFVPGLGPCYRCLYPAPPPGGGSCADVGVLGPLPMVLGGLQAIEALKVLLGIGAPLIGRLAILDALTLTTTEFGAPRDPGCPLCGEAADAARLIDPAAVGARGPTDSDDEEAWALFPHEVPGHAPAPAWLDVREAPGGHPAPDGALAVPLSALPARLATLEAGRAYVAVCDWGDASLAAVRLLRAAGWHESWSLRGGLAALGRTTPG